MLNHKILLIALSTMLLSIGMIAITRCAPGISVTVADIDPFITGAGDTATYMVNVESLTTEDENAIVTVIGDPNLEFNWITQEFILATSATENFGLEATCPGGTPGDFPFTVSVEAWPTWLTYDDAVMLDMVETSSYTDYVHVSPTGVIPEVPLGTAMTGVSMIVALVAYITIPRLKRRQLNTA
jgi:hypothetical protein